MGFQRELACFTRIDREQVAAVARPADLESEMRAFYFFSNP